MTEDWGAAAAWRRRHAYFGALLPFDDGRPIVAMEYRPKLSPRWTRLRELWLGLPPHPHIFDALEPIGDDGVLLRYAAIDWTAPRIYDDGQHKLRARVARRFAQLVDVFAFLYEHVPEEIGLFANPLVRIDLDGLVRVTFQPTPPGYEPPREVVAPSPRWDEQTVVYIVGRLIERLARFEGPTYMAELAEQCVATFSRKRPPSLRELRRTCEQYGADRPWHVSDSERIGFAMIEEGLGWLDLGRFEDARTALEAARGYAHRLEVVHWALERSHQERALGDGSPNPDDVAIRIPHSSTGAVKQWLEALRPRGNETLDGDIPDGSPHGRVLRQARASLKAGDAIYALDRAETLLRWEPDDLDGSTIAIEALIRLRRYDEALVHADGLVRRAADVGRHHYLRAKALFRLGRLAEAREVFELALSLDPKLVEAMLLRREVDRAMKAARLEAGMQTERTVDVPASLDALRELILGATAREIIDALSEPQYAGNLDAQLMLARYFAVDGEPDRASAIYDRVALAPPPYRQRALVGKAGLLLDAGAHESALALFDVLCAESPGDLDACEGRAQTLERLGRLGEAAAEYRRFVGLANARADLRVRAARHWLDVHVL